MRENKPILKTRTKIDPKLHTMQGKTLSNNENPVPAFDAGDPILANLNKVNYSKYLRMSVKALNNLPKPIKKKLQTDDAFLIEYAKRNSLSRAMSFACRDKLNEEALIRAFIYIEPSTAINKAGGEVRKNADLVALAFQVANRRNIKAPKIPKELQENVEFLVTLVKENPSYINLLTPRQMKDEKLMLTMLKTAPDAKEVRDVITSSHNEESLAKNENFMRDAVEISPKLISSIDPENTDLLQDIIEKTPEAELHLNAEQKESLEEAEAEEHSEAQAEEAKEDTPKFEEKKELDAEESIKNIPRRKVHNPDHDLGREM